MEKICQISSAGSKTRATSDPGNVKEKNTAQMGGEGEE